MCPRCSTTLSPQLMLTDRRWTYYCGIRQGRMIMIVFGNYPIRFATAARDARVVAASASRPAAGRACRRGRRAPQDTDVVLLCYSVDNPTSFSNVSDKWLPELQHFCPTVPFILIALKTDLFDDPTTIAKCVWRGARRAAHARAHLLTHRPIVDAGVAAHAVTAATARHHRAVAGAAPAQPAGGKRGADLDRAGPAAGRIDWRGGLCGLLIAEEHQCRHGVSAGRAGRAG